MIYIIFRYIGFYILEITIVSGNFSAFWLGMCFIILMYTSYIASGYIPSNLMVYPSIFAFGLVAFGLLAMEIAISPEFRGIAPYLGAVFLIIALAFVYRSFYSMQIIKN